MNTESCSELWIAAAKALAIDPQAEVKCPSCKQGLLKTKDEAFGIGKIDRYMYCESCGEWNVLTMVKPQ